MKKIFHIFIYYLSLLFVLNLNVYAQQEKRDEKPVIINDKFYSNFKKIDPIKRNDYLDSLLNKIIQCKGYIKSVGKYDRYRRQFKITLYQKSQKMKILFYVFTDNSEYMNILNENDPFEFKGQFVIYTPLDSKSNSYIFDIILEDGALVVE